MAAPSANIACLFLLLEAGTALAAPVPLELHNFAHITVGDLPPTRYRRGPEGLQMHVDRSASFLLLPLDQPTVVRGLRLRWRSSGTYAVPSARAEESKSGDDQRLRVGLLIAGDPPSVPFFAPAWVKAVKAHLRWPSDRMVTFVGGSRHAPTERWRSPYSSSIECIALGGRPAPDGWIRSEVRMDGPVSVVGVWLMADGDDTGARFETDLAELELD